MSLGLCDRAFRADWRTGSVADMERELIERASAMGDTEFSVKRASLIRAGGWWPGSLADWQTPRGRALAADAEIALTTMLARITS